MNFNVQRPGQRCAAAAAPHCRFARTMSSSALALVLLAACLGLAAAAPPYPYLDPTLPIPARTANLLSLLTLAEKVSLLDASGPAIPRISLPAYSLARECERGDSSGRTGTTFPSGAALAASWDEQLVQQVARLTALEARANSNSGNGGGGVLLWASDQLHPRWEVGPHK